MLFVALVGSFACGIYDLITSNIPDKVCIAMIVIGLLTHSYTGMITGDYTNLMNSLLFGGIFLAFGLAMYYTGQWGGGDGELLLTIGILLPNIASPARFPFAISFFINSFFIGAIFSVIYSLFMMYRNKKVWQNFIKSFQTEEMKISIFLLTTISIIFFLSSQVLPLLISLVILTLIVFQRFAKSVEIGFLKRIPSSKLKVDDTIGQDLPKLGIHQKLIKGLTMQQIRKIRRHKKYVVIKEGIRYGIVFPLSILFTLFFGDFIFLFF